MITPSRAELVTILEGIDTAVVVVDRDWRLTYYNAAADGLLRKLGRTGEALSGKVFWLEFPELIGTPCDHEFHRAFAQGVTVDFDTHYPPLDRWLRIHATPTPEGLVVSLADITLRNLAERSRRELEDFFENATIGLHWVGPDGIILRANQAELDLLGYTREEYVGRSITEFHADAAVIADVLQRLAGGETVRNQEARLRCKDGSIKRVLLDSSVRWGPNGEYLHTRCVTRDVTEVRQIAEDRARLFESERAARAEAEAANRSKDEFLAILSHELRTPLTAVVGWARMLRTAKLDAEAQARALAAIERNTRAQTQLINDLLDVSRIVTGKLEMQQEPVPVLPAIEASIDSVAETAEAKGVTIEAALDRDAGAVLGDEMRLCQIVSNLLTNAVKFTPEGGRIVLGLARSGDEVVITVADNGVGIAPADLPRVFDRFHQGHVPRRSSAGGLGLGLAIVQHLVKQHGGRVTADSDGIGAGAQFSVYLPRLEDSRATALRRLHLVPAAEVELRGIDVLVVEDDPDSREIIHEILRSQGADVRTVGSAEEALEALAQSKPDVLVSDIGLGGIDGFGLMRRVRALRSPVAEIPAIALTAYARAEDRASALAAGYQVHIKKPLEPTELRVAVARLAEEGRRRAAEPRAG